MGFIVITSLPPCNTFTTNICCKNASIFLRSSAIVLVVVLIWSAYFLNNKIKEIRDYCETDVINTYLVLLRYLLISSNISQKKYNDLQDEIFNFLEKSDKEHWKDFCLNCDRGL